ncbi:helix-turn-helix domain-containing protein [Neobacillus drentensis]|uniref:helix-turn-helix domain-containing protein n=1 Tax=Neobacillus drentensis TaxID=220684 RepID=UPI0030033A81
MKYEKGKLSYRDISKQLGVVQQTIQKWVAIFQAHGEELLRKNYTKYSAEFKMDVLNYMHDNGASQTL